MIVQLSVLKRIHAYWIAAGEAWKLTGMATMPACDREEYVQKHVSPALKQQTLAAALELSVGRRPYHSINALIDSVIASRLPEFSAADRA